MAVDPFPLDSDEQLAPGDVTGVGDDRGDVTGEILGGGARCYRNPECFGNL